MSDPPPPATYSDVTASFSSFLIVTIHTLLRARSLYPPNSFLTSRAYNFPVAQSRHPAVCQWVADAVSAVQAQLLRPNDIDGDVGGWAEKIVLVIFNERSEVMERWVFDLSQWLRVPRLETDTEVVREAPAPPNVRVTNWNPPENTHVDLAEQFRATLSQIATLSSKLVPLPNGCTFSLAIEVSDEGDPPIGHPQAWIPVPPNLQRRALEERPGDDQSKNSTSTTPGTLKDLGGAKCIPVRKVDWGEVVFELWVEEGAAKLGIPKDG